MRSVKIIGLAFLISISGHSHSCPEEAGKPQSNDVDQAQTTGPGRNDTSNPDRGGNAGSDVDRGSSSNSSSGSRGFEESGGGSGNESRNTDF